MEWNQAPSSIRSAAACQYLLPQYCALNPLVQERHLFRGVEPMLAAGHHSERGDSHWWQVGGLRKRSGTQTTEYRFVQTSSNHCY